MMSLLSGICRGGGGGGRGDVCSFSHMTNMALFNYFA